MRGVILRGPGFTLQPTTAAWALECWPMVSGAPGRALTRLMSWEPPKSREKQKAYGQFCEAGWRQGNPLTWTLVIEGESAGSVGLHDVSRTQNSAEIGVWIAPRFHRQGLGLRACRSVIDFGFRRLALRRIAYTYFEGNAASAALARALGAKPEGCLRDAVRKRGRYLDKFVCGILKQEWRKH